MEPRDLGVEAAGSAFVFLMTEDPRYLELSKRCLRASVAYYELCYEQRRASTGIRRRECMRRWPGIGSTTR
jgi:hypothetical protein